MLKAALIAFVLVLLVVGIYFFAFQQNQPGLSTQPNPVTNVTNKITKASPTPTVTPTAEEDLTALERDLTDINNTDNSFLQELNSL